MSTSDIESAGTVELLAAQRQTAANSLIKNYVIAATGLGLIPIPLADLGGFMALQIKLVHGLAKHYGVPFKENIGKSVITSLLSSVGSVVAVMGLSSIAKTVPGLGTLGGGASVAITAGALTYAVGQVFAKHFALGGTLLDFDAKEMRELFKRKLQEGKDAVKKMREEDPAKSASGAAAAATK